MMRFFCVIFIISLVEGSSVEVCTSRNGECKPLRECAMRQHITMFYEDQFCDPERTLFCCINLITTTEALSMKVQTIDEMMPFKDHPNFNQFDHENCGLIPPGMRIANGKVADIFEFPFVALLGYPKDERNEILYGCGGTLISGKFNLNFQILN